MKFNIMQPSSLLSEYIRFYWTLEGEEAYVHYTMADIYPELIFHYKGKSDEYMEDGSKINSFVSGFHGQNNTRRIFKNDGRFGIFGVYFYPHAIPVLFNLPADKTTNELISLQNFFGQEACRIEDEIMIADNHDARIKILEDIFKSRLALVSYRNLPVIEAIKTVIRQDGSVKMNELVKKYFLSERQFERQFLKYAGFNPKLFSRIVRFHKAMAQYGTRTKSLTEIALECGYYDQSHFINDFKQFSGLKPKQFFSGDSEATEWRN